MTNWMGEGRTAVITGAAGGIGLEAARRFAIAGMNVVLADVKQEELAKAEQSLKATGKDVLAIMCDVSDCPSSGNLRLQVA